MITYDIKQGFFFMFTKRAFQVFTTGVKYFSNSIRNPRIYSLNYISHHSPNSKHKNAAKATPKMAIILYIFGTEFPV